MRFPRVLLWLLLIALLVLGAARLRFDVEILNLLPGKLAVARGLKIYQQNFSDARELILTLAAPSEEEAEAAARALAHLLRQQTNLVTDVTWQPAWLEHPGEAAEFVAYLWLNQPPALFRAMTARLGPAERQRVLQETREKLATSMSPQDLAQRAYDPYGLLALPETPGTAGLTVGRGEEFFVAPDGTFRLLFVKAKPEIIDYRACRAWLLQMQGIIARAQATGEISKSARIEYTGRPAFVTEIAGGMENDMAGSAGGTLATIGLLFWLTHRRLRPLLWLLFLLMVILAGTTALGGLIFGAINVVSMGFAAILLGLGEDFGIVIYQESRSHPELNAAALRREVAPGIFWSAVTSAGAFLTLNLSVLPGLGQLGSLVAIGIILAALVMLYIFLPAVLRLRRERDRRGDAEASGEKWLLFKAHQPLPRPVTWSITGLLALGAVALIAREGVRFDHSPNVLKPKRSSANAALERIKERFDRRQEPLWVLVPGQTESEVGERLLRVENLLRQAVSDQQILGFNLPTALWPQPQNQQTNRGTLTALLGQRQAIQRDALEAGFSTNALLLTENILNCWQRAAERTEVFWPTNHASRWVFEKVVARPAHGFLALGLIRPTPNPAGAQKLAATWPAELERDGVILSGWELLGSTVFDLVVREFPKVVLPIFLLVVASLWLAFRNLKEVVLSLITLAFSGLLLGAVMDLLRWDWNILNLMALPLLLGMGVDFSIHIQLALRRHQGDFMAVRRSVGRALLLAGSTTVAGFASLAFSTNSGMASLGKVAALGITLALLVAVYLLPVWWQAWVPSRVRV